MPRTGKLGRLVFSSSDDPRRPHKLFGRKGGQTIVSLLGSVAEGLFSTVFPSDCRLCGFPLTRISRLPVCQPCLASAQALAEPVCAACGQRAPDEDVLCPECRRYPPPYLRAVAYGHYDGALRELIHLLKYQRIHPAAEVLGHFLAKAIARLAPDFGAEAPLVVTVPLHASKLRQRGFNQSELIARAAVRELKAGSPADGFARVCLSVSSSALVRRRATESQTGLSRAQRRLNLRGAFTVARPNEIAGRDILLVDDVFTTGTTVAECARLLRRAGSGRIWVATVATVLSSNASSLSEEKSEGLAVRAAAGHA